MLETLALSLEKALQQRDNLATCVKKSRLEVK